MCSGRNRSRWTRCSILCCACGMKAFGVGAFALRLPALLGFLLMQVCLFFFVRRLAGERAGVVAAAFPALTATLFYSAEGRPYGLMLGLYALALLSWTHRWRMTRHGETENREQGTGCRRRGWALMGLAAAIALTINAHYFGILLLVPLCAAEGVSQLAAAADGLAGGGGDLRGDGGVRGDVAVFAGCERVPEELLQRGIGGAARYYARVPVGLCGLHADVNAGTASVDGCAGGVCGGAGAGLRRVSCVGSWGRGFRWRSGCCCSCWRRFPSAAICWRGL